MPSDPIVEAALRCFARWGVTKTSLDDVAAEAGVGRSTVYRAFPGGKSGLIDAATEHEVDRFMVTFDARVSAAPDLEETIVAALVLGAEALQTWPALRAVLFHAAAADVGHDTYSEQALVLRKLHELMTPYLLRFVDEDLAHDIVDWGGRLGISYALVPDGRRDLTDPDVTRRLVVDLFLPAVHARTSKVSTS